MQTKHFKPLTLKNTDTNIYLIPRRRNSKKFDHKKSKRKMKLSFFFSSLLIAFTKNIYNLKKFNKLIIII